MTVKQALEAVMVSNPKSPMLKEFRKTGLVDDFLSLPEGVTEQWRKRKLSLQEMKAAAKDIRVSKMKLTFPGNNDNTGYNGKNEESHALAGSNGASRKLPAADLPAAAAANRERDWYNDKPRTRYSRGAVHQLPEYSDFASVEEYMKAVAAYDAATAKFVPKLKGIDLVEAVRKSIG